MDPKEQSSQGHSRFEWGLPQVMQRAGRLSALREISAQGHRTEKARGLRQPRIPGTLRTKTIMKTKLITTALATVLAITCAYSQDSMKTAPASDALLRPDRCAQQQDLQDTGFRAGQLDDSAREILPIRIRRTPRTMKIPSTTSITSSIPTISGATRSEKRISNAAPTARFCRGGS